MNMTYINRIAPKHERKSCDADTGNNAKCSEDDGGGCFRCTLLRAAQPDEGSDYEEDD